MRRRLPGLEGAGVMNFLGPEAGASPPRWLMMQESLGDGD